MKRALLLFLLAGSTMFAGTRFYFGVGVGAPVAPPVAVYAPPCPGPGYTWVPGYWYWSGPHRYWHNGWWRPPAYRGWGFGFRYDAPRNFYRHHDRDDHWRGRGHGWGHDRDHDRDRGRWRH
jgi:hypothetical protein